MPKHIAVPVAHNTTSARTSDDWFLAQLAAHREIGYRVAYRILASWPDAEDALQEALIDAWKARATFRGDESTFRGWFATIASRAAIDLVRKRKRIRERESSADALHGETANLLMLVVDDERLPDERLLTQEALQALIVAVRQLPEMYREVILLHYGENLTCQQMAERLGVGMSTVKTRLYRAYRQLKGLDGMHGLLEVITRDR